jgi:hypothetical protein
MPPIEEQQYYVLSGIDIEQGCRHLWFATEAVTNECLGVSNNLKHAWLSEVYSDKEAELIYIEKEKIDRLTYSNIEKARHVDNNRENRKKLGLKYKDEVLQRATGAGVDEDYILLLEDAKQGSLALPFKSDTQGVWRTNDLRSASVAEAPLNVDILYLKKEKVEKLATLFPDGSRVLLNALSNLKVLGLEYKEGVLQQVEIEEVSEEAPKVSWLKIGLSAFSLAMDLKKAYEQSNPKSRTTNIRTREPFHGKEY